MPLNILSFSSPSDIRLQMIKYLRRTATTKMPATFFLASHFRWLKYLCESRSTLILCFLMLSVYFRFVCASFFYHRRMWCMLLANEFIFIRCEHFFVCAPSFHEFSHISNRTDIRYVFCFSFLPFLPLSLTLWHCLTFFFLWSFVYLICAIPHITANCFTFDERKTLQCPVIN